MGGMAQDFVPMRQKYGRFVQLSNKGAKEMGFKDTGAMWRSNYDMTPEQFSAEMERLWDRLRRSIFRCTPTCARNW